MNNLSYNLIFRPEPEGGFTVTVPALQGCVTYGKNLKKAKAMALDAIVGYIASLKKHGQPIPSDQDSFISAVQVNDYSSKEKIVHVKSSSTYAS
ncbi:type II toxin-antitoxin system HicB family antitoxin [Candidatus Uhrbacteria bacterium]|nr:type II toxin-antitoxin system HicB family antitoxin [Candidatus Uhrbacteria bacterium]